MQPVTFTFCMRDDYIPSSSLFGPLRELFAREQLLVPQADFLYIFFSLSLLCNVKIQTESSTLHNVTLSSSPFPLLSETLASK